MDSTPGNRADYCEFNKQNDLFVTATFQGFTVYQTDPFGVSVEREISERVLMVEILGRSNFLAIVTARRPCCVQFWDDNKMSFAMEIDFVDQPVVAMKIRRDVVICVLANEVRVYQFAAKVVLLHSFHTPGNELGLVDVSGGADCTIVFPTNPTGSVQIVRYGRLKFEVDTPEHNVPSDTIVLSVHNSSVRSVCISFDGLVLATASRTGTLIRVWDAIRGHQIAELRRGLDHAMIQSLSFSPSSHDGRLRLAVISNKATAHIFNLNNVGTRSSDNRKSSLSALAAVGVDYFGSHWAIALARIVDPASSRGGIRQNTDHSFRIGWCSNQIFVVLSTERKLWKYVIHQDPGGKLSCQLEAHRQWISNQN